MLESQSGFYENINAKRPKRVALFSDILVRDADGAMRTIFQLTDRVDKHEIQFYFITSQELELGADGYLLPSLALPFNKRYRIVVPLFAQYKLFKVLDTWQPDVLHITSPSLLGNIALKYAKRRRLPVLSIYHTHFVAYIQYYFSKFPVAIPVVKLILHRWMCTFYNQCQCILVPTTRILQELTKMGIESKKLILWSRGIDTEIFQPRHRNEQLILHLTGNKNPTIFFAGRIVWEKNLALLIKIFQNVRNIKKGWNFIIAGDGPALRELKLLLPDAIYTGALDHQSLATMYASCDVFLLPSSTETFGNVLLEAMASGIPCIAARSGGPVSLITHGQNGFLCNPGDPDEWIETITELFENEPKRQKIVLNAKAKIQQHSWPLIVSQYCSIVDQQIPL